MTTAVLRYRFDDNAPGRIHHAGIGELGAAFASSGIPDADRLIKLADTIKSSVSGFT
jgi:hypothetical protein